MSKINIDVPDGRSGLWAVETFTITPKDHATLFIHYPGRAPRVGTYKRLVRYDDYGHNGGTTVMSNTQAECLDHRDFIDKATGVVLINGLGLGMCLKAILENPAVTRVYVVEASADVIKLVAPTYQPDPRVEIIHHNAYTYTPPPGVVFDCVWHDIWDTICADNLPQMSRLERKYRRIANWQGSWCKRECQKKKRSELA